MKYLTKATALTVSSIFPIWQWHTSLKWQVHRPPAKKMRNCIKASNALSEQLADAHYTDTTIEISPEMQLIIYRHWGPPHIILSVKVQRVAENKNTDKK